MKKIYQMPAVRWMEAQTEQMIAQSLNVAFGEGTKDGGVAASRRRGESDWDDEEE